MFIDGIANAVSLREVSRGSYKSIYVVRCGDQLRGGMTAHAYWINNGRESTWRYPTDGNVASDQDKRCSQQPLACVGCATVESVKPIEMQNSDPKNIIGTMAGGLLDGVLGNQVGGGT